MKMGQILQLQWDFPGPSRGVPLYIFQQAIFQRYHKFYQTFSITTQIQNFVSFIDFEKHCYTAVDP